MNDVNQLQIAANYMGAVAHLLGGKPGRYAEFIAKVELLLSANAPHARQLMQFTTSVQQTGRPVIWIHHSAGMPHQPQIGLVAICDGRTYFIENCMLWQSSRNSRAVLVPDSFSLGAFRFDDDLQLRHASKAPARSFAAAERRMVNTYSRLLEIEREQRVAGEMFTLPQLAKAA